MCPGVLICLNDSGSIELPTRGLSEEAGGDWRLEATDLCLLLRWRRRQAGCDGNANVWWSFNVIELVDIVYKELSIIGFN